MFTPFQVLGMWFRGLLSLAILAAGIAAFSYWYQNREITTVEPVPANVRQTGEAQTPNDPTPTTTRTRTTSWQFGWNWETACLVGGLALFAWSIGGGWAFRPWLWRKSGTNEPHQEEIRNPTFLKRPDGSELCVAIDGANDAEPIVFTHGWGLDSSEWFYAKRELNAYRLITWDLPGTGRSSRPVDRDWSLEKLACDLDAVISLAGGKPVTLVGHSIGVMIILTYCRLFPAALGTRVGRIVLAHGTYINPVRTSSNPPLHTALQKPVLEPLCHLMVWLSPVVRLLNWMSYLNGSAHRSVDRDSFSGNETRGQLSFLTRLYCTSAPDVIGRGMLAMLKLDETNTLAQIPVPALIVAGENDQTCTVEASEFMAAHIPQSELFVMPAMKHCGHFEQHELFHQKVTRFLAATEDDVRIRADAEPVRLDPAMKMPTSAATG